MQEDIAMKFGDLTSYNRDLQYLRNLDNVIFGTRAMMLHSSCQTSNALVFS